MKHGLEKIEALLPDFQYVDDDRIITSVGLTASLYFWGGHTPEKRQAIIELFEAYEKAYGSELKWGCDPESWQTRKLAGKKFPKLRDYAAKLDEDDCIQWYLSSGEHRQQATEYAIFCLTERGWHKGRISELYFQLPRGHAFDPHHRKTLDSLLLRGIETLNPFHGRVGLAAVLPEQTIPYEPEAFDLATRYRTLYIPGAGDFMRAPYGPKSVDWITIIGDVLAERCGGINTYAEYCRQLGITSIRHGNSLVLRARETPEIGPVDEAISEDYARVNTALRPLRDGAYNSMGSASNWGELRFNRFTSDLWIRRFDQGDAWPPVFPLDPADLLAGSTPKRKIRLRTGQPSPCYGRFHRPGTEKFGVILMPGDIAPYWLNLGPHGEFLGREAITWELLAEL